VKPDMAETYICTPIMMDTELTHYIVGFRPNATKMTAHHMLVFGCEEPGSMMPTWNCGEMTTKQPGLVTHQPCQGESQIIYAWAMDAPKLELPDQVGFRVGADSTIQYLVLQVHYGSVDHIDPEGDDSGVFLQYTDVEQPKTAGVLLLGTGGSAPPHSTTYFETACDIEDERTIHPFAFRTHTHQLGKVVSGWKVSDKERWELIGKKDPQLPEMFYPAATSLSLSQGDTVAARCTMVNTRDRVTYIGTTQEDEMCNYYLMYWVQGKKPMEKTSCFTRGPPTWSWGGWFGGGLTNIPEQEASTL